MDATTRREREMMRNTDQAVRPGSARRLLTCLPDVGAAAVGVLLLALLAPPRSASATGPVEEFPVSTTSPNQLAPAIGGDLVV